jgi:signal transduction histidine kinase
MADRSRATGLRVGHVLALSIGVLLLLAVVAIGLALSANAKLTDRRKLVVDRVAPAQVAALGLENALVNEETGVRGYLLTREAQFLAPYRDGRRQELLGYRRLAALGGAGTAGADADVRAVRAQADAWRRDFVVAALGDRRGAAGSATALASTGKVRFDAVRSALARLQSGLAATRGDARGELFDAARVLQATLLLSGLLILAGLLGAGLLLRRVVTAPLGRLGREARRVAGGDFQTPLTSPGGAREIRDVGADMDEMRERIVRELSAVDAARASLEAQAVELTRSNRELEQFAYVASHDLQEPLRKVASFCQALQRRYQGQLDDRADQYIEFAVDGATRMQVLINDLLAFSRVGRSGRDHELVEAGELVAAACAALSTVIDDTGTTVDVSRLPVVSGDRTLLVSLFQNLVANAVKFRGADPPVVRIAARRLEAEWEFSCADNGIGIEPEYAERIFVIFQRLHAKEAYPGTGIGLALCRKIVEHHGGRIWLDADQVPGACFRFTLPIAEETTS